MTNSWHISFDRIIKNNISVWWKTDKLNSKNRVLCNNLDTVYNYCPYYFNYRWHMIFDMLCFCFHSSQSIFLIYLVISPLTLFVYRVCCLISTHSNMVKFLNFLLLLTSSLIPLWSLYFNFFEGCLMA